MRLLKRFSVLSFLTLALLTSCGGDDDSPSVPTETYVIRASVDDGATIAPETDCITLYCNTDVTVNSAVAATLNGVPVTLSSDAYTQSRVLVALPTLDNGTSYTLSLPEGALYGPKKSPLRSYTLSFKTTGAPSLPDVEITETLIDPKATQAARDLYSLLRSNYGKKIFSGAMGEVGWGTAYVDAVAEAAGACPAIVGFDFIHLPYSPSNWIDYSDITPVRKAWEAGCIPAFTWHWNVPTSQGGTDMSFNAQSSAFDASKVTVPGTWENEVAEADVAKMAATLLKIQEAGIPVLWRPFHEANGDFTWGAWFWWGKKGPQVVKQLWSWLYDKLTVEYDIHNLVWVWTVDYSSEGRLADLSLLRSAYPGDDKVDILGADIYEDAAFGVRTDVFTLLRSVGSGRKMVALSECGKLLSPDKALSDGALWSYFMAWYEWNDNGPAIGTDFSTASEWRTVLHNPLVINRGDFSLR